MYELPTEIKVNETSLAIRNKGDYRMVLDCFRALNDVSISKQDRMIACLAIFLDDIKDETEVYALDNLQEICEQMMLFFNCGQQEVGKKTSYKLIDWDRDSLMICSAINNVAGKEIRVEPYIHWWTFMGYYMAIGESPLSMVVGIRSKQSKGEKLEKYEKKFVKDNPQYFNWDRRSAEDIEFENQIKAMWNKQEG